jgi:hypothetical protein
VLHKTILTRITPIDADFADSNGTSDQNDFSIVVNPFLNAAAGRRGCAFSLEHASLTTEE